MRFYVTDTYSSATEDEKLAVVTISNTLTEQPKTYTYYEKECIEAGNSEANTEIYIEDQKLHITTDESTQYFVSFGNWGARFEYVMGAGVTLETVQKWATSGKALFCFEFLAVYIDSNEANIKFYLPFDYYLKADGGNGTVVLYEGH